MKDVKDWLGWRNGIRNGQRSHIFYRNKSRTGLGNEYAHSACGLVNNVEDFELEHGVPVDAYSHCIKCADKEGIATPSFHNEFNPKPTDKGEARASYEDGLIPHKVFQEFLSLEAKLQRRLERVQTILAQMSLVNSDKG